MVGRGVADKCTALAALDEEIDDELRDHFGDFARLRQAVGRRHRALACPATGNVSAPDNACGECDHFGDFAHRG